MKECSTCGAIKPLDKYPKNKQCKSGRSGKCKDCVSKYKAQWREANPASHRAHHLRTKYGLSIEGFNQLLEIQNYTCLLCDHKHVENCQKNALRVDHNHRTGEVRGLLCKECNSGMGLLGDNPERLRAAARYLESRGHYG